jgi:Dolichyl-phosphate-mannose-protein mannosyltransferase
MYCGMTKAGESDSYRKAHIHTSSPDLTTASLVTKHPGRSWFAVSLSLIVLAGLAARLAILLPHVRGGELDDLDKYLPLARSIADGEGFSIRGRPTAYRPPLYPLVLMPVVRFSADPARGVAALHLVLGGATVILTGLAARRWGLSINSALVASAIVALDPVLIAQSRVVMTETLAACLAAGMLWSVTLPGRLGPIGGGVLLGLSALCRPTALAIAVLTGVGAAFDRSDPKADRWIRAVVLLVVTFLTIAPWAVRNALVLGEVVWTTTHGGYTLGLANNDIYYDEIVNGPPGKVWTGQNQRIWWDACTIATRGMSEAGADRWMRDRAIATIRRRPGDFLRASVARLGRFWGAAPSSAVYPRTFRIATACWTVPLWIALWAGLFRRENWRWPRLAAPATLLALTLVHSVYWTDMRMRAAAVPAIALIAASARGRGAVFEDENGQAIRR